MCFTFDQNFDATYCIGMSYIDDDCPLVAQSLNHVAIPHGATAVRTRITAVGGLGQWREIHRREVEGQGYTVLEYLGLQKLIEDRIQGGGDSC